jgi:hypothetical protein
MTDTPDPKLKDKLHPPVPATRAMPAGRIIAIVVDPAQRPWEIVLHEAEREYTVRTPPGYAGEDETNATGLMYRTDYATAGWLITNRGIRVPAYVEKAIKDGRVCKGWEPGTHLFATLARQQWALASERFVESLVNDDFMDIEGASATPVDVAPKPWWQRAAEKLGAFVAPRRAAAADAKPEEQKP